MPGWIARGHVCWMVSLSRRAARDQQVRVTWPQACVLEACGKRCLASTAMRSTSLSRDARSSRAQAQRQLMLRRSSSWSLGQFREVVCLRLATRQQSLRMSPQAERAARRQAPTAAPRPAAAVPLKSVRAGRRRRSRAVQWRRPLDEMTLDAPSRCMLEQPPRQGRVQSTRLAFRRAADAAQVRRRPAASHRSSRGDLRPAAMVFRRWRVPLPPTRGSPIPEGRYRTCDTRPRRGH